MIQRDTQMSNRPKPRSAKRPPTAQELSARLEDLVTSPTPPRTRRNTLPNVTHDIDPDYRDETTTRAASTPRGTRSVTRHENLSLERTPRPLDDHDDHEEDDHDGHDDNIPPTSRRRRASLPDTNLTPKKGTTPKKATPKKSKTKAKAAMSAAMSADQNHEGEIKHLYRY